MKKKTLNVYLIIAFLILTIYTCYPQTQIFTIDEAIKTALENNHEMKVALLNVKKSEAAIREAFGYALPSVDVSANFSHFLLKPKMAFPDFAALLGNATYEILFEEGVLERDNSKFQPVQSSLQSFAQTNNYEATVQVTQTLFNSAVFRGIGASQIYADLYKQELSRIRSETILTVKKSFYGVLLMRELSDIASTSYNNARDNLKNVKALYGEGLVSEFDMLQAEVRVENIYPSVLETENRLKDIKNKLKLVLGIEQSEDIDVEGNVDYEETNPVRDDIISEVKKSNASLKSLKLKADVDEEFIALDRAEYWPVLYAFGNYSYAGSGEQFIFQNYSSSIIGLTFGMNLWNGNRTKNKVQQSEIGLRQTEEQITQLESFVVSEAKSKLDELNRVKLLLEAQKRNVTLAQKAYDISVTRYKEGTGSQLEIENADVALRQARINRLNVIYDYIIASAELDLLMGKIDPAYTNIPEN